MIFLSRATRTPTHGAAHGVRCLFRRASAAALRQINRARGGTTHERAHRRQIAGLDPSGGAGIAADLKTSRRSASMALPSPPR